MIESLAGLLALMKSHGATRFYVKKLAPNDNSKNQIYLGGDFSALNVIPHGSIRTDESDLAGSKRDRAKAEIRFFWVDEDGLHAAPNAQLVLYPKYPEVRMSGFLRGCRVAPSHVLSSRDEGRVLVLGVSSNAEVLGYAAEPTSPVASEIRAKSDLNSVGVFFELPADPTRKDTKTLLLAKLADIYRKHWISSQKLDASGVKPYNARNGGGYTLEAELGILPNGYAEPDYLGWEIKQYGVRDFTLFAPKSPITLMTPEPTGGVYREKGVDVFIRRFGYEDVGGIPDRLNFGGVHSCSAGFHPRTGLKLELEGYDRTAGTITNMDGGIALVTRSGEIAALWKFSGIIEHWSRKHAQAAYVPSLFRTPPPEYCYGPCILLCEEAEFGLLLKALLAGSVYYDPGIKMEGASTDRPEIKRRSQFRVRRDHLSQLYVRHEHVSLKPE